MMTLIEYDIRILLDMSYFAGKIIIIMHFKIVREILSGLGIALEIVSS